MLACIKNAHLSFVPLNSSIMLLHWFYKLFHGNKDEWLSVGSHLGTLVNCFRRVKFIYLTALEILTILFI